MGPDTNIFPTPAKGTRKVKQAAQPRKRKLHFDSQLEISSRQIQEQMQNPAGTVSIECFLPKYAASVKLRKAEALGMQHMFDASPFDNMVPELQSLWSNHLSVKPHRELPLRLAREAEPAVAMQSDEAGYKRGGGLQREPRSASCIHSTRCSEPGSPRFEIHEAPLLGDDSFMPADGNFEFAPEDVVPQEHFLECANGVDTPRGNRILQEAGTPFILDAGEMVRSNGKRPLSRTLFRRDAAELLTLDTVTDRPTESQVDESNPQLTTEAAKVRLQSVFKDQRPGTSVSFIELTGSRKRDEAVRLFFEILLLKTSNVINVEQGEPYGTILVSQRSL